LLIRYVYVRYVINTLRIRPELENYIESSAYSPNFHTSGIRWLNRQGVTAPLETVVFLFHLLSTTSKRFSSLSTRLANAVRFGFFYKKTRYINSLLLCPRPRRGGGGIRRSSASVCPSDVAYIGSNSKTKRPRKTKLCIGVSQVTCSHATPTPTSRSKVKVTGRRHIVAAT